MENKHQIKHVLKYAGGFVAWVIGSGFATGQEILQFFTSYGYWSYGALAISLIGFFFIGRTLFLTGYEHKDEEFRHYVYFCGKTLGRFYEVVIPFILMMSMSIMIAASGAMANEYYGIPSIVGTLIMAFLTWAIYLVGFEKMLNIVSKISPLIIVFTVIVALYTVFHDYGNFLQSSDNLLTLSKLQPHSNWIISGIIYTSLNFLAGSIYFTEVGRSAVSKTAAKQGAALGAIALVLTMALLSTAMLINSKITAGLSVPTLYLATKMLPQLGAVFSVILMLGIFSCCCTMMWSFSSRFYVNEPRKNKIVATIAIIGMMVIGLLPFTKLIALLYPIFGMLGLPFMAAVIYKGFRIKHE